jgi:UDP-glucose 4-epimerase
LHTSSSFRVFNIGSGAATSLLELLAAIRRVTGRSPHVNFKEGRPFDVPNNELDIRRAKQEIGWRPTVSLDEGISRTWASLVAAYT